ncbi:hypothetical protein ABEB36_008395 [Hypothenemus hampei]|uniref:Uncharacterized protein n=1 Tax=Hypothenemus hampei TaxID=57062 RepID=A0ABD1ELP2_HYPHA
MELLNAYHVQNAITAFRMCRGHKDLSKATQAHNIHSASRLVHPDATSRPELGRSGNWDRDLPRRFVSKSINMNRNLSDCLKIWFLVVIMPIKNYNFNTL